MNNNGVLIHRGKCDCVRRAFHIVDRDGDLYGLAFDEHLASAMKRRFEKKNPGVSLEIDVRNIFTIAAHVDEEGRYS
jgi:hypothetical protein